MIILEGPDNSGKTTLQEQLIKDLGLQKSKLKFNPEGKKDVKKYVAEYYDEVIQYLREEDMGNIIWDRNYFSELIHGPILRGGIGLTLDQQEVLPQIMEVLDPLIIYCNPGLEKILLGYGDRYQYADKEKMFNIVKAYDDWYDDLKYKYKIHYQYNNTSYEYKVLKRFTELYLEVKNYRDGLTKI